MIEPWNATDVFPKRPDGHDYGYLSAGKLWPCSREDLIRKCKRNEIPSVHLVWTPEHQWLIPPYEAAFLREALKSRTKQHLGIHAFNAVFMVALWSVFLVIEPSGWPLFIALLILAGLLPLWEAIKAWRGLKTDPSQKLEEAHLVAVARYAHWIAQRPPMGTSLLAAALLAVGAFEIVSHAQNGGSLDNAIECAGLVKHDALGSEFWRLATGPMLHGHFFHLFFNLSALLVLAGLIEALGSPHHAGIVFFSAMIAGSVTSTLLLPEVPSVGASGGIMGLLGFLLVLGYIKRKSLPLPLHKSMLRAAVLVGFSGVLAHAYIDNAAHGGGFVVGALLGLTMVRGDAPLPLRSGLVVRNLGWLALTMITLAAGGAAFAMGHRIFDPLVVIVCAVTAATAAFRSRTNALAAIPVAQPGEKQRTWQTTRENPAIGFSRRQTCLFIPLALVGSALATLPFVFHLRSGWILFLAWLGLWAASVALLWGRSFVITWLGGLIVSLVLLSLIVALLETREPQEATEGDRVRPPRTVQSIPGWGEFIDPAGDCTFTVGDESITIKVPGGIHDLSPQHRSMNAPRILQEVDGDFTVEVKVVAEFQSGDAVVRSQTLPSIGAGLLLWDTDRNYLRLECDAWVTPQGELASYGPLFEYWKDGKNMKLKRGITRPLYERSSTSLRITRRDAEIRSDISHDGVTWINVDSVIAQLPKRIWVGVAAINTSNDPFAVEFAGFTLTGN